MISPAEVPGVMNSTRAKGSTALASLRSILQVVYWFLLEYCSGLLWSYSVLEAGSTHCLSSSEPLPGLGLTFQSPDCHGYCSHVPSKTNKVFDALKM